MGTIPTSSLDAAALSTVTSLATEPNSSDAPSASEATSWPTRPREALHAGLVLALMLALFFSDALFHGNRVLNPADQLFATPFFAASAPPGFTQPANAILTDQVYQFAPWRHF
ncbi:MAG TPA: hypothetical protein VGP33_00710, partial [Chloroflexota bacterium]|nr:hypothetical protein [Chloroflexota bacterium]